MQTPQAVTAMDIELTVNGERVVHRVPVRQNLADFLRDTLGLTGTHVGCEHGVCGACTVRCDGAIVRACLMLAVQADGTDIVNHTNDSGVDRVGGWFIPAVGAASAVQAIAWGTIKQQLR